MKSKRTKKEAINEMAITEACHSRMKISRFDTTNSCNTCGASSSRFADTMLRRMYLETRSP